MYKLANTALELFKKGYSCSESIVIASQQLGIISNELKPEVLLKIASAFSGGMGSGCLCGAVSGAQVVIGLISGRSDVSQNPAEVKSKAKELIDKFREKNKVNCCKALTASYDFASKERRENCGYIVMDTAIILEEMLKNAQKERVEA